METIKLDLIPGKKMPSLHASQYDDGREHGIDLFENGVVYKLDGTETLTINERKGDDCICSLDIENTFADSNHIVFASTEQMCAVWGNNICELVIKRGSVTLGTLNFILEVEPSPTENGIESESEIKNLERQIEEIAEEVIGDDYYTAEETDDAIATAVEGKADKDNTYTKTEVNTRLNNKMDKSNPTGTGKLSVGSNVLNLGQGSHALGSDILTYGQNTLAVGKGTGAASDNQFVFGKYNQQDWSGNYVEVVGNGTNGHPSNARTLDWQGNEMLAGDLIFNRSFSLTQKLSEKAEKSNTYTKSEVDTLIDNLPEPMIFKGTLGVGGTIQTLPTASASNEGFTYKVITDGTYAGQTAKNGDVFTSNGSAWVLIPSGDEDNDTWRAIKVNGVEKLGNGISSGAVDFVGSENIEVEFDGNGNKVGIKTKNIYTESEVDDLLEDKADADNTYTKAQVDDIVYGILPDDTASGAIANFNTSLALPIKSLEVDVNAVQENGTPTPSSPKAISGWNAITLDANGNTEVINLGGTYYGGRFTQDKNGHRQFIVTHRYALLNDENIWQNTTGTVTFFYNYAFADRKLFATSTEGVICSAYPIGSLNGYARWRSAMGYFFGINDNTVTLDDIKALARNGDIAIAYEIAVPIVIDLPDGEPIITLNGTNNIYADTGDTEVVFKSSVNDYVSAHSGGNLLGMGGVYLGGAKSGGGEEEPDEGEDTEDTEKTKLDEPKEEIKTIGDMKKLGGE